MKGKCQAGFVATRKVAFPWWIKNDGGSKFEIRVILVRDVTDSQIIKNRPITMMITCCGPMGNDKRQPIPTTFIDTLFKIVRGRGLVKRSSANDHFLQ
jgi:hypothetical protein